MKKEILKTLAYADIFDYPLNSQEVWNFLIAEKQVKRDAVQVALSQMSADLKLIDSDGEYFFLRGRKEIVETRRKRERWSRPKLRIAEKVAEILRKIPWIKLIGITGTLAMENSDEEDDIDLFIITAKNRLWLTRGLVVTFLCLTGLYRRPGKIKNKICPNMLLDEDHLKIPKKEQDLFSAHEVCQMRLIWERNDIYAKFLQANSWVRRFLPNGIINSKFKIVNKQSSLLHNIKYTYKKSNILNSFLNLICVFDIFESLSRKFQLWYMRDRRTTEIIEPGRIRFHPQDARKWILPEYQKRLVSLNLA